MSLVFCTGRKPDSSEKDSCRNARPCADGGTGEFTVNVLIEEHADAATTASKSLPHGVSEFGPAQLQPVPGVLVGCPRVNGSPIAFECRTTTVVPCGEAFVVIGEVVHVTIEESLLQRPSFHIDLDRLGAVGRMGLTEFVRTSNRFEVDRRKYLTRSAPSLGASQNGQRTEDRRPKADPAIPTIHSAMSPPNPPIPSRPRRSDHPA